MLLELFSYDSFVLVLVFAYVIIKSSSFFFYRNSFQFFVFVNFSQNSIHVEKKQRGSDVCALKVHIINTNPYVEINPHTH